MPRLQLVSSEVDTDYLKKEVASKRVEKMIWTREHRRSFDVSSLGEYSEWKIYWEENKFRK